MELNNRCIFATTTIVVLVIFFVTVLGLTMRYSRNQYEPCSVSDFHRFEPPSSIERFFCPHYDLVSTLDDACGTSNADQYFELYSLNNFESKSPEYLEQNLTIYDSRRLDPLQHHTFVFHGVLQGSRFDLIPCVRWMHNSEIRDGHNAATFVMIIQGAQNLSMVRENLSPEKTIDQICNGHCLNSRGIQNDKSCPILPTQVDPNCSLCIMSGASVWDDYHFLVYNPQRKGTVVVSTAIVLRRQHWDILAMGGRKIRDPTNNCTRFHTRSVKSRETRSYFVSFPFTNDNLGGEQCSINLDYKCDLHWVFLFGVGCFVVLAVVMICCCCVVCQGDKCYGYNRMRENGDGNE